MSEKFQFQKLEATGNDFILVDARKQDIPYEHLADISLKICHRKTGIGADGLLILYPDSTMGADYTMIYKNADGSDAGMCGNGGRAIAFYASQNGFSNTHRFQVHDQIYEAFVHPGSHQVEFDSQTLMHLVLISEQWVAQLNQVRPSQKPNSETTNPQDLLLNRHKVYPQTEHVVLLPMIR